MTRIEKELEKKGYRPKGKVLGFMPLFEHEKTKIQVMPISCDTVLYCENGKDVTYKEIGEL